MPRARLLAVFALGAALLVPGAQGAVTGDQRVLVVLATYGPRPYTVADVQATMKETALVQVQQSWFRVDHFSVLRTIW